MILKGKNQCTGLKTLEEWGRQVNFPSKTKGLLANFQAGRQG